MTDTWYRVHFRKGERLVHGNAELERVKARKAPKVVLVELAKIHECSVCEKREAWTDSWIWYGSYQDLEDGKPIEKFCSELCKEREAMRTAPVPDKAVPTLLSEYQQHTRISAHEPNAFVPGAWLKLDAARAAANPRKYPEETFENQGAGWCRWCGEEILETKGKNKGKRSKRRNWCHGHYYEYQLRTQSAVQMSYVADRDGLQCAICKGGWKYSAGEYAVGTASPEYWGDEAWPDARKTIDGVQVGRVSFIRMVSNDGKLEVDHIAPLWAVAHLPDYIRREFFGPDNLWLLCDPCHKAKSKREAADRAAGRAPESVADLIRSLEDLEGAG